MVVSIGILLILVMHSIYKQSIDLMVVDLIENHFYKYIEKFQNFILNLC